MFSGSEATESGGVAFENTSAGLNMGALRSMISCSSSDDSEVRESSKSSSSEDMLYDDESDTTEGSY